MTLSMKSYHEKLSLRNYCLKYEYSIIFYIIIMGTILSSNKGCVTPPTPPTSPTLSTILINDGLKDIEYNKNPYGVARRLMENILQYRSTNIYEELQFGFINYDILYDDVGKALFHAAKGYYKDMIKYFMTKCRKHDRIKGWNHVMYGAAMGGHMDLVLHAILNGARDFCFGVSCAVSGGHLDIIKYLVELGQHVSYYNVYRAARKGRTDILEYFASIDIKNWNWALRGAAEGGHLETVEYLISKGANDWDSAMIGAKENNHLHIIEYITAKRT